jgi:BirA family biotin operon repressor/biotin-[acetyl-CoA-carboxylase] ligase
LESIKDKLPIEWIGEKFHYYASVGSTNDVALRLAAHGESHGTLIIADEQMSGKGREGKAWITQAGSALAFSLIFQSSRIKTDLLPRLNALGSLAVAEALAKRGLSPLMKWPNDVLLQDKKAAGVLLEGSWAADKVDFAVLGVGVNVNLESTPAGEEIDFPAISVSDAIQGQVERIDLLLDILSAIAIWYPKIESEAFIARWDEYLAYKGERVEVGKDGDQLAGQLLGLSPEGYLRLNTEHDGIVLARRQSTLRLLS